MINIINRNKNLNYFNSLQTYYITQKRIKKIPFTLSKKYHFNNNYIFSGYIIKRKNVYYFDMKECIGPHSVHSSLVTEKIKLNADK